MRASEMLRDTQTEQLKILNEAAKVANGWITDDEAAETITGHPATGTKAVAPAPQAAPGIGNVDGQPSVTDGNNAMYLKEIREARIDIDKTLAMLSTNCYHASKPL